MMVILDRTLDQQVSARFRAMGSDGHIVVNSDVPGLLGRAHRRIDELEQRWSRFVPTSEVSELNRRSGQWVTVSADTVLLLRRSVEAYVMSGGSFDPTVAGAVIRAGYDRSFDDLGVDHVGGSSAAGCADVEIRGRGDWRTS